MGEMGYLKSGHGKQYKRNDSGNGMDENRERGKYLPSFYKHILLAGQESGIYF